MKRMLFKLALYFSLGILVVGGLFLWSQNKTRKDNGFYRLLPPHPVTRSSAIDLGYNSYYFAGAEGDTVYLSNYTAPLHLLKITLPDLDTTHILLRLTNADKTKFHQTTRVSVLAPYVYISDGIAPKLLRGKLGIWKAGPFMEENTYFLEAKPIDEKSMAIQAIGSKTKERILGKITDKMPRAKLFSGLLEKQIDGVFCTDGKLYYNKSLSQLIYVYNYRNQFMVMDTLLDLVYRGRTIDTTSQAKIKTYSLDNGKSKGLANKPLLVNRLSATAGNYLFINSSLMAKNEDNEIFLTNSIIDIYNLVDKSYQFSFYLPKFGASELSDFIITNDYLISLNKTSLSLYLINPSTFGQDGHTEQGHTERDNPFGP